MLDRCFTALTPGEVPGEGKRVGKRNFSFLSVAVCHKLE